MKSLTDQHHGYLNCFRYSYLHLDRYIRKTFRSIGRREDTEDISTRKCLNDLIILYQNWIKNTCIKLRKHSKATAALNRYSRPIFKNSVLYLSGFTTLPSLVLSNEDICEVRYHPALVPAAEYKLNAQLPSEHVLWGMTIEHGIFRITPRIQMSNRYIM